MDPRTKSQINSQQNPMELISKYTRLLWNKKYWIILITILVSVIWFVLFKYFLKIEPEYSATVIIKFDNPRYNRASAVTDISQMGAEGKMAFLTTKQLLTGVIDSLNLDLIVQPSDVSRFDLIKDVKYSEKFDYGVYRFQYIDNKIKCFFSNKGENIEEYEISSVNITDTNTSNLSINGGILVLNNNVIINNKEVTITYASKRFLIEKLRNNLSHSLDRSRTVLTLTYKDTDPAVTAAVINTLANMYMEDLLNFKKLKTTSVINSLRGQLAVSKGELEISENRLRQFRERNPYVSLTGEGSNIINNLTGQQLEYRNIDEILQQLNDLTAQKSKSGNENRYLTYQEILSILAAQNVTGTNVVIEEFNQLVNARSILLNDNYSSQHPNVISIETDLARLIKNVDNRTSKYMQQLRSRWQSLQTTIDVNERNLRSLPRNELRLAELERDRAVKSEIYTNILIRYNEAEISDSSIMPDAFIIEEADIPLVFESLIDRLINLLIGPILGIFMGIGFFIMLDYLDDSVKESKEIEAKIQLPVLSTIPVIIDNKEFPDDIGSLGDLDPKLITSDYGPSIASEQFRLLRTKILTGNNKDSKSFIITSLSPGDGKSLIASNLAITFAQQKLRTILLDCDLRRGVQHKTFKCAKKPGLTDCLIGTHSIDTSELPQFVQNTHIPNLFLVSSGLQVPNPAELLGSERMKSLYLMLRENFDIIIMDSPPIEIMPDALIMNSYIHNIFLVVRYGISKFNKINDKLSEYANIREDISGLVLNAVEETSIKNYQSYSYYHY